MKIKTKLPGKREPKGSPGPAAINSELPLRAPGWGGEGGLFFFFLSFFFLTEKTRVDLRC